MQVDERQLTDQLEEFLVDFEENLAEVDRQINIKRNVGEAKEIVDRMDAVKDALFELKDILHFPEWFTEDMQSYYDQAYKLMYPDEEEEEEEEEEEFEEEDED